MRRVPIRVRVAAAFAVAMAVVLVCTGWFLYARLGSHLSAALDRELRVRADDLSALVRDERTARPLSTDSGARFVEQGEAYAQLLDGQGRVLDATPPLGTTPLLDAAQLREASSANVMFNQGPVPGLDEGSRVLATPVERGGQRLVLVVGLTRQDRAETLAGLRRELLIAGPIALVLATAAGYLLAGLALRPVEAMRRRAAVISAERASERLPVPETGDEIEALAETLNSMLARLEAGLERERAFVADAGHELRTPLALLRTELELALRQGESQEELRDAVARSTVEVDRLAQLADALLLIARSDNGEIPLRVEPLGGAALLGAVAERFRWRAEREGRALTVAAAAVALRGDRLRLEQALGTLVDNALRHGGGDVTLAAVKTDANVELHVRDHGGGFPPEFLDHAFERFSRPEPGRDGAGAGLGLSIVRAIALAHGGGVGAANTAGGADVWISLPAAAADQSLA